MLSVPFRLVVRSAKHAAALCLLLIDRGRRTSRKLRRVVHCHLHRSIHTPVARALVVCGGRLHLARTVHGDSCNSDGLSSWSPERDEGRVLGEERNRSIASASWPPCCQGISYTVWFCWLEWRYSSAVSPLRCALGLTIHRIHNPRTGLHLSESGGW